MLLAAQLLVNSKIGYDLFRNNALRIMLPIFTALLAEHTSNCLPLQSFFTAPNATPRAASLKLLCNSAHMMWNRCMTSKKLSQNTVVALRIDETHAKECSSFFRQTSMIRYALDEKNVLAKTASTRLVKPFPEN